MPIYHFHFDGDADGKASKRSLAGIASAKDEAAKTIGKMLCDASDTAWDLSDWGVTVTDEAGLTLFSMLVHTDDRTAVQSPSPGG